MQHGAERRICCGGRLYVAAICFVAALGGLLFGYDTAVIAGAIGFLATHFQLDPAMKGWATSCALLGCVVGVALAGEVSDRLGRKKTLVLSGAVFLLSSLGTALPQSFAQFVVFRVLAGVGVGVASMASPVYIAEVSPARIRGRMVSTNQFAIVTGMLVIYFVNYFIALQGTGDWNITTGWRWMFASGALPSALFLILLFAAPESPRWLVKQGRSRQALTVLERIDGPDSAKAELAAIEAALAQESGSLGQLLHPGMRRALGIGVALAVLQQITGINVFIYYAPEIFKKLGSQVDAALLETVALGGVNLLFTVVAIYTVDRWGRKPLMMIGAVGMGLCLLSMGLAFQAQAGAGWMLALVLSYIACFALSIGPVTWVILSEIFPTRIRGRAMGLATLCLWIANFGVSQTFPMMDDNRWLIRRFDHAFPFYVYGLLCAVMFLVVWRLVPETKGKSLEEIEACWGGGSGAIGRNQ
jgi:sugar porter (SP) family MFS transporter